MRTNNNNFEIKNIINKGELCNLLKDFVNIEIDYLTYKTKEKTNENYIIKAYK